MTASESVFLYGTLCDPDLLGIVAGTRLTSIAATLTDHRVTWASGQSFPLILDAPGQTAAGLLVEVPPEVRQRLDFYELGFGYDLLPATVTIDTGPRSALVYKPRTGLWLPGAPWSLADWQTDHGALTREAALEYMRLIDTHSGGDAAPLFDQIRTRAASRLRAKDRPSPSSLAPDMTGIRPAIQDTTQPYTGYFAVREDVLSFPLFDGSTSAYVKRASFQGGDAVTVLPYDARNDTVLVVRQFRHGPFCRGDNNPWTLEPAAGRIDIGETPEQAARRELAEEAGVPVSDLILVGRYYPSPGAYSEFLYSYVALADLSQTDGTVAGLDSEAEDIMSHVLPFNRAMAMIETGEANTGPLLISLGWLAANRDRLRTQDN